MELISSIFSGSLKRHWRRRKYQRLGGSTATRNVKVIRFGGVAKRSLGFRVVPKLRLKMVSPVKLWSKLKNAYIHMMISLAPKGSYLSNGNVFGGKRIPKGRQVHTKYSNSEFENRLIYEIYKSLVPSRELYGF